MTGTHRKEKREETDGTLRGTVEPDPNNAEIVPVDEKERDHKRRMFWQVAALNGMDVQSTFNFCREFVYGDELTIGQTQHLIEHYHSEITTASGVVNTIVANSFESLSVIKRAEAINRGLRTTVKLIEATEMTIDKLLDPRKDKRDTEASADRVSKLAIRNKQLADTYSKWNAERNDWQKEAETLLTQEAYTKARIMGASEDEQKILDVSKIRTLMVQRGVDPIISDHLAGLIATGDYFLNEKEKQDTSRYLASENDEHEREDSNAESNGVAEEHIGA